MQAKHVCLKYKNHTKNCISNLVSRESKAFPLKYKHRMQKKGQIY